MYGPSYCFIIKLFLNRYLPSHKMPTESGKEVTEASCEIEPLVGPLVPLDSLLPSYENASLPGFIAGINYLSSKYRHMRRVKGDGNCFYRCYLFAYLDRLLEVNSVDATRHQAVEELSRVKSAVIKSRGKYVSNK